MTLTNAPLVSCICVTHNSEQLLKKSIRCFQYQTYPNKELILAFTSDNEKVNTLLTQLNDSRLKALEIPATLSLGQKRNFAIENSGGFYFCTWDDDDWYGNERIEFQVKSLEGTTCKSSVLSNVILYDGEKKEAYLSAIRWAWEQTLLCERAVFENPALRYANLEQGEDSVLIYNLKKNDLLFTTSNPGLYVYVYHGKNTCHRKHWKENLLRWATKLTHEQCAIIEKITEDYSSLETLKVKF